MGADFRRLDGLLNPRFDEIEGWRGSIVNKLSRLNESSERFRDWDRCPALSSPPSQWRNYSRGFVGFCIVSWGVDSLVTVKPVLVCLVRDSLNILAKIQNISPFNFLILIFQTLSSVMVFHVWYI